MEKFLTKKRTREVSDLLGKSENERENATCQTGWDNYEYLNSNVISSNSLCQAIMKSKNKGWSVINGERIYSTFRSGKRVSKGGREGMMLAVVDKQTNKKKVNQL